MHRKSGEVALKVDGLGLSEVWCCSDSYFFVGKGYPLSDHVDIAWVRVGLCLAFDLFFLHSFVFNLDADSYSLFRCKALIRHSLKGLRVPQEFLCNAFCKASGAL